LPEDDPDILERFLEFLYTGNYSENSKKITEKPSDATLVTTMSAKRVDRCLRRPPGVLLMEATPDQPSTTEVAESSDIQSEMSYEESGSDLEYSDEDYEEPDGEPDDGHHSDEGDGPDLEARVAAAHSQALIDSHNNLFIPLRVYIMAEKYDVPALRLLARDRFYRTAELIWAEAECFPDVVDELYSGTPHTETAMRDIVCRLVSQRIQEDEIRRKLQPVMSEHGDFAVGVMEYMIHRSTTIWR
jgi:hypothetical protein